jgi:hypothetical protein
MLCLDLESRKPLVSVLCSGKFALKPPGICVAGVSKKYVVVQSKL